MRFALLFPLIAGLALASTTPPELRVSMIVLGVTDQARSIRFYRETLGLDLVGKPGEVTIIRAGPINIALNLPLGRNAGTMIVGATEIIFPVESVAGSYRKLVDRGCEFSHNPHEVFAGTWAATFTDPDGHRLTILGPQ